MLRQQMDWRRTEWCGHPLGAFTLKRTLQAVRGHFRSVLQSIAIGEKRSLNLSTEWETARSHSENVAENERGCLSRA
jgi:hypothetical protein